MRVRFSSTFIKASKKLSGKMREALKRTIEEVKAAKTLHSVTNCKKLVGYGKVYRIRIGDYRALLTLEIEIEGDTAFFQYLVSRGEAYGKRVSKELKRVDEQSSTVM